MTLSRLHSDSGRTSHCCWSLRSAGMAKRMHTRHTEGYARYPCSDHNSRTEHELHNRWPDDGYGGRRNTVRVNLCRAVGRRRSWYRSRDAAQNPDQRVRLEQVRQPQIASRRTPLTRQSTLNYEEPLWRVGAPGSSRRRRLHRRLVGARLLNRVCSVVVPLDFRDIGVGRHIDKRVRSLRDIVVGRHIDIAVVSLGEEDAFGPTASI